MKGNKFPKKKATEMKERMQRDLMYGARSRLVATYSSTSSRANCFEDFLNTFTRDRDVITKTLWREDVVKPLCDGPCCSHFLTLFIDLHQCSASFYWSLCRLICLRQPNSVGGIHHGHLCGSLQNKFWIHIRVYDVLAQNYC